MTYQCTICSQTGAKGIRKEQEGRMQFIAIFCRICYSNYIRRIGELMNEGPPDEKHTLKLVRIGQAEAQVLTEFGIAGN